VFKRIFSKKKKKKKKERNLLLKRQVCLLGNKIKREKIFVVIGMVILGRALELFI
jgi:hypothetical protein